MSLHKQNEHKAYLLLILDIFNSDFVDSAHILPCFLWRCPRWEACHPVMHWPFACNRGERVTAYEQFLLYFYMEIKKNIIQ